MEGVGEGDSVTEPGRAFSCETPPLSCDGWPRSRATSIPSWWREGPGRRTNPNGTRDESALGRMQKDRRDRRGTSSLPASRAGRLDALSRGSVSRIDASSWPVRVTPFSHGKLHRTPPHQLTQHTHVYTHLLPARRPFLPGTRAVAAGLGYSSAGPSATPLVTPSART